MTSLDRHAWQRIAALFDELVELDATERQRRLQELHHTDAVVAHEVQALLHADDTDDGVLESSLQRIAPDLADATTTMPWETVSGSEFGPYRLIERIGEGGMGEVWRAERADGAYRQQVALKLLKRGMDTQAILRRFLQERSILARLEHPNIVRVLDGGMSPDGRPWYAMSHVEGQPIIEYATRQRLDARARIELLATVADAVTYAHAHLVVHRDLKPGNILVDAQGQPRLLDFGIAKVLEDTHQSMATATGVCAMSPAYAAPEQILGQPISTTTDVYALGVVAWQLLTGHMPHRRDTRDLGLLAVQMSLETSGERASQAISQAGDEPLRDTYGEAIDRRRLARQISGDLDLILNKALHPEPERRYAGAAALAVDLRAWLDGRPITARPDSTGYRLRRFVRRHSLGVAATALVALSLLAGLTAALWQAGIARAQAARAEQQALRAETTKNFVVSAFSRLNPTTSRAGIQINLADFVVEQSQRLDEELADAPESRAELRAALGTALQELGRINEAQTTLAQAATEFRALADDFGLARTMIVQIGNAEALGDYRQALALATEAVSLLEATPEASVSQRIEARRRLAAIASSTGQHRQALDQQLAIHAAERQRNGSDHPRDLMNLCIERMHMALYQAAEADCRHALALLHEDPQAPPVPFALVGNVLGVTLQRQSRLPEAEAQFNQAITLVKQYLGDEHPLLIPIRSNLARVWLNRGDIHEAAALVEQISTQMTTTQAHSYQTTYLGLRGLLAIHRGQPHEAAQWWSQALTLARERGTDGTVAMLRIARRRADLHLHGNEHDAAETLLATVLKRFRDNGMTRHDEYALTLKSQARLQSETGHPDRAQALNAQAEQLLREVLGDDHPEIAARTP